MLNRVKIAICNENNMTKFIRFEGKAKFGILKQVVTTEATVLQIIPIIAVWRTNEFEMLWHSSLLSVLITMHCRHIPHS
jgi:6-phosphogluconolactonase/glucosamine-6-phosphate isomerase/deaminase